MSTEQERTTRSEVTGRQIEQARAMYEDAYNGREFRIEPTESDFSYRYTTVGDRELTLRGNLFDGSMRGTIETTGEYIVTWITAGEGVLDEGGDAVRLQHGRPAMFVNNRASEFTFREHKQNLMHFDGTFLERVASEHEGVSPGPLLFNTTAMPSGAALKTWASTVSAVARVIYSADSSALLRSEANRAAAIALLEAFPHESLAAPPELVIPAGGNVRRAIEYLHAHAHLPLSTTDIAENIGISARGLQAAFQRELGVTPNDYLRRIRLDRVRAELRDRAPDATTVADVARAWGFAHLGRFAASYAERFGEYPRTTLQR